MSSNQVTLHRIFTAPPEKVFRAFVNPTAMASWIAPHGFLCNMHEMDFSVGGKFRMSFTNFGTGQSHAFGGQYLEIVPNEFLKYTDVFDDPALEGQITTSVSLRKVLCGTELIITQVDIPAAIPAEMCYLGWQESLDKLKHLVEPNIP